jgi:putative membrane protein
MGRLFLRWILMALSVVAASFVTRALGLDFVVDTESVAGVMQLFLGVALLSLLNATLGKIIKFFTLPLNCLTLGLLSLVVNALILWFAATFELGFRIVAGGFRGFLTAFVASLLISAINGVLGVFVPDGKDD